MVVGLLKAVVGIGGGTGEHDDTVPPVECEILTLTLWALHGKIDAKSRWRPRLGGVVPPLVVGTQSGTAGGWLGTDQERLLTGGRGGGNFRAVASLTAVNQALRAAVNRALRAISGSVVSMSI